MSLNHRLRGISAVVVLAVLLCATVAQAETYTLSDGDTIGGERSALFVYGGYPRSGLAFIAAPMDYFNVGFCVEAAYDPAFGVGAPLKVQMLENDAETLNLALVITPTAWFTFLGSDPDVTIWLDPGVAAGWRFARPVVWYWDVRYAVLVPISEYAEFLHFPKLETGFEFNLSGRFLLSAGGLVEFRRYEASAFGYGGRLGLGIALW